MGLRGALLLCLLCGFFALTPPTGVHLSPGDEPNSITVSWSTDGDSAAGSLLEFLPSGAPESETREVVGASKPFAASPRSWFSNGRTILLHRVTAGGLQPGEVYAYRVGCPATGWSRYFTFTAPRAPEAFSDVAPLRLLVACDAGEVDASRRAALAALAADAASSPFDFWLHCGDIAYDMNDDQGRKADRFLSSIEATAAAVPYLVAPGNHEEAKNFSAFRARFAMPGSGASENLYWSRDFGPVHLVSYNTEAMFWPQWFSEDDAARQHAWLDADLEAANANRDAVPWIIATGHRPMYCVSSLPGGGCDGEHEASRTGTPSLCGLNGHNCAPRSGASFSIENLFHKHGVDLALYGHIHSYARFWPVFAKRVLASGPGAYVNPPATVHVTTGAGGNPEMLVGSRPPPIGACGAPWCAFQSGYAPKPGASADYSYSRIAVGNATHLEFEQFSATLGRVVDSFTIVRSSSKPAFGNRASAAAAAARRRTHKSG